MARRWLDLSLYLTYVLVCLTSIAGAVNVERATTYIVHMDKSAMPNSFASHEHWYKSVLSLAKVSESLDVKDELEKERQDSYLYSYDNVMHGFSAKLTQAQLDRLEEMPGHMLSFPDPKGTLDTTYSYKFLGLNSKSGLWPKARFGQDVIIGVLDTGIWPESPSFRDHGMGDVPSRWKGKCEEGTAFNSSLCNKKLVGARYFNKGYLAQNGTIDPMIDYNSARDFFGHGSHTSSTAAGNYVSHVDFFGYGKGTARGIAPAARVAMYKVGWSGGIAGSDVLAGMDRAIRDGADVLSLSLGFDAPPYFKDIIALGAFAAIERGIIVVCSAGNNGPPPGILHNGAPWIFTIGASTIDRDFQAALKLGDGTVLHGASFYGGKSRFLSKVPLVYPGKSGDPNDKACVNELDRDLVRGKMVLCMSDSFDLPDTIKNAGAFGLISVSESNQVSAFSEFFSIPSAILAHKDGAAIANYSTFASNPVVDIEFEITILGTKPAPAIADFSSRGPTLGSPDILKPDVVAPGVNILAAWLPNISLAGGNDTRRAMYNIISGTSMSCPHVAGLAALVKASYPEWSPAAIRSALMTTSYTLDNTNTTLRDLGNTGLPATPLDFGAGHVDPEKAVDPGLIYDLGVEDYANFLCSLNYTSQQIQVITRSPFKCSSADFGSDSLNYPSFTARFKNGTKSSLREAKKFKRTLTNVGEGASVYKAVVEAPNGFKVQVKPDILVFQEKLEKLSFTVTLEMEESTIVGDEFVRYGYLSWVDKNNHVVKSPLVAMFNK
eukprot:Gb_30208 [translate_table: standard]